MTVGAIFTITFLLTSLPVRAERARVLASNAGIPAGARVLARHRVTCGVAWRKDNSTLLLII